MKMRQYLLVIIGLSMLLPILVTGCFGVEIVHHEDELDKYQDTISPILEEWKAVISDWEGSANDPSRLPYLDVDAERAYSKMESVIASWDAVTSPDEAKEYHLWVRHAMNYEKEAFGVMADYYHLRPYSNAEEFTRLRNLARQMWVLKDEALLKADAAYPK